jgi:hypothetical protein
MRAAVIENGVVVNVIIVDEINSPDLVPAENGLIGDLWNGAAFQTPPPPPPKVPEAVTMRQAKIALRRAGKLAIVNAALQAMPGDAGEDARITWEWSTEVQRQNPLILMMKPVIGMTDQEIDQLFISAALL